MEYLARDLCSSIQLFVSSLSATMVGCHNIIKFKHRILSMFFDKSIVRLFNLKYIKKT